MNRKTLLLFLIIELFYTYLNAQHYSYQLYLKEKETYAQIKDFYDTEDYKMATSLLWQLQTIDMAYVKPLFLARCYSKLNQFDSSRYYLGEAFRKGFNVSYFRPEEFQSLKYDAKIDYESDLQFYLQTIDTTLRVKIQKMVVDDQDIRNKFNSAKEKSARDSLMTFFNEIDSNNLVKLYQLTSANGWPGLAKVGFYAPTDPGPNPDPALIIVHSSEKENVFFLNLIKRACEQNIESWRAAEFVQSNLLFRFSTKDYPYIKLRQTLLNEGCTSLDEEKSLLELNILAKRILDNPQFDIEVHATDLIHSANVSQLLTELKQVLVKYGLNENRIIISEEIVPIQNDGLGKYYFVFKRVKK